MKQNLIKVRMFHTARVRMEAGRGFRTCSTLWCRSQRKKGLFGSPAFIILSGWCKHNSSHHCTHAAKAVPVSVRLLELLFPVARLTLDGVKGPRNMEPNEKNGQNGGIKTQETNSSVWVEATDHKEDGQGVGNSLQCNIPNRVKQAHRSSFTHKYQQQTNRKEEKGSGLNRHKGRPEDNETQVEIRNCLNQGRTNDTHN